MTIQTISKSVQINSTKEKIWNVLTEDRFNRLWYAEFSEGTHALSDWKEGSKVIFKDDTENGLLGKILINNTGNMLSIAYEGVLKDGREDYDSEEANSIKGGKEVYNLVEKDGVFTLIIKSDMAEEYFDYMSTRWDKALLIIKELAEAH